MMMNYLFTLTTLCTLSLAASIPTHADVLYEDDFSGPAGIAVVGRPPAQAGAVVYQGASGKSRLALNGNGQAVAATGTAAVSLPLPPLVQGETVILTLDARPAGGASTYIAVGFTNAADTLSNPDTSELMLSLRPDGLARVFKGSPSGMQIYLGKEPVTGTSKGAANPSRLALSFNTGTRQLIATVTDLVTGKTQVLYNQPFLYTTLEQLKFATIQFAAQDGGSAPLPGLVNSFTVKITPES